MAPQDESLDEGWSRPCYSRPMTARLSNLPPTRIEKLETFLIERWCLLRIHCEDGTVGTGEAGVHGWPRPTAAMIDEMKSYLVGRDPSTIEHHAQALQRHSHFMGALVGGAISAIDIALWDIKARRYGVPIYELMGGKTRDRVRCYMHAKGDTLDELVADAVAKKRQGFTAIRFSPFAPDYHLRKSFEEWVSEAERRVGAVHEALQGDADICIELHRQMNPAESIALGQRLQKFHPYFYEDPMLPDSPAMMGDVQARSGLPVATGERFSSIFQFQELLANNGCAYVRPDVCLCMGLTGSQEGGGDGRGAPRQGDPAQSFVADLDGGLRAARRLHPELRAAGIHGRVGSAQARHGRAAAGVEGWLPRGAGCAGPRHRVERHRPGAAQAARGRDRAADRTGWVGAGLVTGAAARLQPGGENDAVLDDSLLAQALRLIGLDPAQGFKQCVGVLAQQRRTADRDG